MKKDLKNIFRKLSKLIKKISYLEVLELKSKSEEWRDAVRQDIKFMEAYTNFQLTEGKLKIDKAPKSST